MLRLFIPVALVALSACGGSSTGLKATFEPVTPVQSLRAEVDRLSSEIDTSNVTRGEAIPERGTASFSGVAAFGFLVESSLGDGVGGEMTLDVNFANNTLSGDVDNFYSREGDAREGLLTISNGRMLRTESGALMTANVAGQLDIVSGVKELEGEMAGSFSGDTPEHAAGVIELVHQFQLPGEGPIVPVTYEGGFVLEAD